MSPNASLHDPSPSYLRELIASSGLTQADAAARIGISARTMREHLATPKPGRAGSAPYVVQFALENLPGVRPSPRRHK